MNRLVLKIGIDFNHFGLWSENGYFSGLKRDMN